MAKQPTIKTIVLEPQFRKQIQERARSLGLSGSGFIRLCINEKLERDNIRKEGVQ